VCVRLGGAALGLDPNNWACGGQGQGYLHVGPTGAPLAAKGGPVGLLNGARGRSGGGSGGEGFCTAPRTRHGGTECRGISCFEHFLVQLAVVRVPIASPVACCSACATGLLQCMRYRLAAEVFGAQEGHRVAASEDVVKTVHHHLSHLVGWGQPPGTTGKAPKAPN
jgi:hypothetical protein